MTDPELRSSFRSLADRVASIRPREDLEAAVLAEFDRAHRGRRSRVRYTALAGTMAASLLVGALLIHPRPKAPAAPEAEAFLPIPYTPPLKPYERVSVMQADVPVRALIAAGFQVRTSDLSGSVLADVMVSQDGRARAIRPVMLQVSDRSSTR